MSQDMQVNIKALSFEQPSNPSEATESSAGYQKSYLTPGTTMMITLQ